MKKNEVKKIITWWSVFLHPAYSGGLRSCTESAANQLKTHIIVVVEPSIDIDSFRLPGRNIISTETPLSSLTAAKSVSPHPPGPAPPHPASNVRTNYETSSSTRICLLVRTNSLVPVGRKGTYASLNSTLTSCSPHVFVGNACRNIIIS